MTTVAPTYSPETNKVDGRMIIRNNFKALFERNPKVLLFGEDVGKIGDVNQGAEGLQELFGETRISIRGFEKPP